MIAARGGSGRSACQVGSGDTRSGIVRRRRLFFCLFANSESMMRADRNVYPTFKPTSSTGQYWP